MVSRPFLVAQDGPELEEEAEAEVDKVLDGKTCDDVIISLESYCSHHFRYHDLH